jgi:hypothetical protein
VIDDALLDDIYEAALLPDRWEGLLGSICTFAECQGGAVIAIEPMGTATGPAVLRYKATGRYAEVYSNFKEVARIPNPALTAPSATGSGISSPIWRSARRRSLTPTKAISGSSILRA